MNEIKKPLYFQIYSELIDEIKDGKLNAGDRMLTEKELAEKYNVSRITSRRALDMLGENGYINRTPGRGSYVKNHAPFISPETEVKDDSKSEVLLIGLIIPDFGTSYGMDILSGAEKEATANGCRFTFYRTYGQQDLEEAAIDELLEMGVDGLIIMPVHGQHYNPKILKMVLDGFPFVMIDRCLKGIPAPFVGSDNVEAAKKITDFVLDLGHKYVSFISPPEIDTSTIEDRIEGFVKSHAERGVPVNDSYRITNLTSTVPGKNIKENIQDDIELVKKVLCDNPEITCLFVVEYNLAMLVVEAVKALGKKVPDDYAVVCFDGPFNQIGDYTFTHIRQKEMEMGSRAVKMLLEHIQGKLGSQKVYLETELVIGLSTKKLKD
ncbi:MAG TPA: GntR family transcriptional regulator [Ruminiclostridium sp.]